MRDGHAGGEGGPGRRAGKAGREGGQGGRPRNHASGAGEAWARGGRNPAGGRHARPAKERGFVGLQAPSRRWPVGHRDRRHQCPDLLALGGRECGQRLGPRIEAFGGSTVGEEDFVRIEEKVEIVDLAPPQALDGGAVDEVACGGENLRFAEVEFRLPAGEQHPVLRRDAQRANVAETAGGDFHRRGAFRNGERLHLTPLEWSLLRTMATQAGRTLTHRQLFDAVWARSHGNASQYLRVFITALRKKIEPDPSSPQLIVTEPGVGYRFEIPRQG